MLKLKLLLILLFIFQPKSIVFANPEILPCILEQLTQNDSGPKIMRLKPLTKKFKKSREIEPDEMQSNHLKSLNANLIATMNSLKVNTLTAPQIGENLQIIAIKDPLNGPTILMNPKVVSRSKNTILSTENCVTTNNKCSVKRSKSITIEYNTLTGERKSRTYKGFNAKNIQHSLDQLEGLSPYFRSKRFLRTFGNLDLNSLSDESKTQIIHFLKNLNAKEKSIFKLDHLEDFNDAVKELNDPWEILATLSEVKSVNGQEGRVSEILDLYKIKLNDLSEAQKYKKYDQWVKSDVHALYIYDNLLFKNDKKSTALLNYLIQYNKFFKNLTLQQNKNNKVAISYSYEKESSIPEITLWYKTPEYSDEEWLMLPEETRLEKIKNATNIKKKKISNDRITGTSFKPEHLSGYSQEYNLPGEASDAYAWELANKAYEISLPRLMGQVNDMIKFTKESHSFHTHVVFDIDKDYKHFENFQLWSKLVNDFLYMRGMEEGLHGNYLTTVANLPGSNVPRTKSHVNNELPKKLEDISLESHKFFSMGVRTEIYGNSSIPNHIKIGLELRDTTRSPVKLEEYMTQISTAVKNLSWEKMDLDLLKTNEIGKLSPSENHLKKFVKDKVSKDFYNILKENLNNSLPLDNYEIKKFYDVERNEFVELSQDQRRNITIARDLYIQELKKIDKNIQEMNTNGESYEKEDIEMAIQMSMSEWAKRVRLSELFSFK